MGSAYPLYGHAILVIEDDPLIAVDVAEVFQSAGARVVATRTLAEAGTAIERADIRAALLDYRLGDGDVAMLCRSLVDHQIPFMIYTGYDDLHERFPTHIVMRKPASAEALLHAMVGLVSPAPSGRSDPNVSSEIKSHSNELGATGACL
jgi:DNA-binding response OmpR family regulator